MNCFGCRRSRTHWKADINVNVGCPCMQETQTKPEGQIHFFPIIFNSEQLYNTMVERCGPSQTSAPKE